MARNDDNVDTASDAGRRVTFILRHDDAVKLDEIAKRRRTTVSAVIREVIGAELDRLDADD